MSRRATSRPIASRQKHAVPNDKRYAAASPYAMELMPRTSFITMHNFLGVLGKELYKQLNNRKLNRQQPPRRQGHRKSRIRLDDRQSKMAQQSNFQNLAISCVSAKKGEISKIKIKNENE